MTTDRDIRERDRSALLEALAQDAEPYMERARKAAPPAGPGYDYTTPALRRFAEEVRRLSAEGVDVEAAARSIDQKARDGAITPAAYRKLRGALAESPKDIARRHKDLVKRMSDQQAAWLDAALPAVPERTAEIESAKQDIRDALAGVEPDKRAAKGQELLRRFVGAGDPAGLKALASSWAGDLLGPEDGKSLREEAIRLAPMSKAVNGRERQLLRAASDALPALANAASAHSAVGQSIAGDLPSVVQSESEVELARLREAVGRMRQAGAPEGPAS